MQLLYVPSSADVREGDLLVSTGLEGRFPRGYPVATVTQVERSRGSSFLFISARPEAHIQRASHVLLVNHDKPPALPMEQAPHECAAQIFRYRTNHPDVFGGDRKN